MVRWKNGHITVLSTGSSDILMLPYGANDHGALTGFIETASPAWPALWRNGVITQLDTQSGDGTAINNHGVITGLIIPSSDNNYHAFVWRNGQFTILAGPPNAYANSINDNGDVVGIGAQTGQSLLWLGCGTAPTTCGMPLALPLLASAFGGGTRANDINSHGAIVGYGPPKGGSGYTIEHAMLWTH